MKHEFSNILRKWWKWVIIVALVAAFGYRAEFVAVPGSTKPVVGYIACLAASMVCSSP